MPSPLSHPTAERIVTCPACQGPSLYGTTNAWRPFCSQRCKLMDLGAWASERFGLPETIESTEEMPSLRT